MFWLPTRRRKGKILRKCSIKIGSREYVQFLNTIQSDFITNSSINFSSKTVIGGCPPVMIWSQDREIVFLVLMSNTNLTIWIKKYFTGRKLSTETLVEEIKPANMEKFDIENRFVFGNCRQSEVWSKRQHFWIAVYIGLHKYKAVNWDLFGEKTCSSGEIWVWVSVCVNVNSVFGCFGQSKVKCKEENRWLFAEVVFAK